LSEFNRRHSAEQVSDGVDLSGRHALVTGANTGIGRETARVLALRGASVTMACRDLEKAKRARDEIVAQSGSTIPAERLDVGELDLASLASVRNFGARFLESGRPLHLLVNNAGVMLPSRRQTADGFEAHFGINHLGHFLLTHQLLGVLEASAPARVICVASDALAAASLDDQFADLNWESRRFSGFRSYGDSKLMNVMFAAELTRRMKGAGVVANALHPGIVKTELGRDQPWYFSLVAVFMLPILKSPERGASTTVYAATSPRYSDRGGLYFADNAEKSIPKLARDPQACARLWEISEELAGVRATEGS
jgi:NAD(P)-dependent dehydrogenase (short-subunit alcohol dehydrogenase family)